MNGGPFTVYIYQTKGKWAYAILRKAGMTELADRLAAATGKVVGESICDKTYELDIDADGRLSCTIGRPTVATLGTTSTHLRAGKGRAACLRRGEEAVVRAPSHGNDDLCEGKAAERVQGLDARGEADLPPAAILDVPYVSNEC